MSLAALTRPLASRMLCQRLPVTVAARRSIPAFPRGTTIRSFSRSSQFEVKKYTESHEWVELDGNVATIGITEYAAKSLGDVVYVELPTADLEVAAGEPVGAVESVKSASDVLSPVSGKVIDGNAVLGDKPKTINESPEGEGWIAKIEVNDPSEVEGLMDQKAYLESVEDH
ncbi:glycine cleavage system H protein [Talaromyces stipitatus ATCC 10500]|uniref:Glycine cleavage system H protein n=1 Tax=Talaromyces stipitatus (strain ATCC 10500 / CBS 375.48 / QM 6759 / NRRL 1006) TaxID=441959 RepID=B8MK37_TALSN|nr:glycine cleavage system H protein [Talaromyces stipitatus ATCC 10500]EED14854.1 glycine cleavage system H protein [Talaromyces stipitatus ATCC 10500]